MFYKYRISKLVTPILISMLFLSSIALAADETVPAPHETPAAVIVSGHTSTFVNMKVEHVGQNIPSTYSDGYTTNTTGFSWYVSRHYAMKTDYPRELAEFYLSLIEMSWPHYVEIFGGEPDTSSKRLAIVYASSGKNMMKALRSDGEEWFKGGGITMFHSKISYMYQSYPLETAWDQPRYIILHEGVHQFQMALNGHVEPTPIWYYEGVADRFGSHIYERDFRRLTINVFDKAAPMNMIQEGLDEWRKMPPGSFVKQIRDSSWGSRGKAAVMIAFFNSTPDRMQRFRIWRDEMFNARFPSSSANIMENAFGSLDMLGKEFEEWAAAQRLTFRSYGRNWAQDSDTLWSSTSYPGSRRTTWEQVLLSPGDSPRENLYSLDYPPQQPSELVGEVERGVAEPSVACVVDLSKNPQRGSAGFGLGIRAKKAAASNSLPEGVSILIDSSTKLVVDGTGAGMDFLSFNLPDNVREAIAAGGYKAGITAKIKENYLEISVRAKNSAKKDVDLFIRRVPILPIQRARLLMLGMALFASDGHHGVTQYFDVCPRNYPDLNVPAPANIWRNPGDKQLYALYSEAYRLGSRAPSSLLRLRNEMADAADEGPEIQAAALEKYRKQLPEIIRAIGRSEAERLPR